MLVQLQSAAYQRRKVSDSDYPPETPGDFRLAGCWIPSTSPNGHPIPLKMPFRIPNKPQQIIRFY